MSGEDETELNRILSMSEGELRAELRAEGRDPDQVIADMRAHLEAAQAACGTFAESEARLVAEVARLTKELAAVNNEFGSHTPDWPEAWKRVADLKQLAGDRWRENARLRIALHDAIRRPLGVMPDSALEFYDQRMADEAEQRRPRMTDSPSPFRSRLTPPLRTEGEG